MPTLSHGARPIPRAVERGGAACFVAILLLAGGASASAQEIGYVVDLEGGWFLDGLASRRLVKGQGVPPGRTIRNPHPDEHHYIVVAYKDKRIHTLRCRLDGGRTSTECPRGFKTYDRLNGPTWKQALVAAVSAALGRNPGRYSVHIVRAGDGNLREAVLRSQGGAVDLAPAFGEMRKGTYYALLRPRSGEGFGDPVGHEPFTLKWDPAAPAPAPLRVSQIAPGLYELSLLERRGTGFRPTLVTAWVLIAAPADYARAAAEFSDAADGTSAWAAQVGKGTVRSVLRAALEQLASSPRAAAK